MPSISTRTAPFAALVAALFAALAIALASAPVADASVGACASASASPANVKKRTIVRATLCLVNATRVRHGLHKLRLNPRLSAAARRHVRDMGLRKYFAHDSLGGGSFVDRIRRTGYLSRAMRWTVGENLAWGTGSRATPGSIVRAWMRSRGHRANILSASYREIGIGIARRAPLHGLDGAAGTYATEFGARG